MQCRYRNQNKDGEVIRDCKNESLEGHTTCVKHYSAGKSTKQCGRSLRCKNEPLDRCSKCLFKFFRSPETKTCPNCNVLFLN